GLGAVAGGWAEAGLPGHQLGQEVARMGTQSTGAGWIDENHRVFRPAAAVRPKRGALTDPLGQTRPLIAVPPQASACFHPNHIAREHIVTTHCASKRPATA